VDTGATQQSFLGALADGPFVDAKWKCRVCKKLPGEHPVSTAGGDAVLLLQHAQLSCRTFLEATAHNFQAQHAKQQSCSVNCSPMDTSTLFNHMETCTSKAKHVRTWTQLLHPGASHLGDSNAAWQTLSASVHASFKAFDGGEVHVPSTLPPAQTRFLVRLYQGQGYTVKIVLVNGTMRDPIADEVKTPPREQDDYQPASVDQKSKKKKSLSEGEQSDDDESVKKSKKKKFQPEVEQNEDDESVEKKKSKKSKKLKAEAEQSEELEKKSKRNRCKPVRSW